MTGPRILTLGHRTVSADGQMPVNAPGIVGCEASRPSRRPGPGNTGAGGQTSLYGTTVARNIECLISKSLRPHSLLPVHSSWVKRGPLVCLFRGKRSFLADLDAKSARLWYLKRTPLEKAATAHHLTSSHCRPYVEAWIRSALQASPSPREEHSLGIIAGISVGPSNCQQAWSVLWEVAIQARPLWRTRVVQSQERTSSGPARRS